MKEELKSKAVTLRKKGYSVVEISSRLKISKGCASLWLRDVPLSKIAKTRLENNSQLGRLKGVETNRLKKEALIEEISQKVKQETRSIKRNTILNKAFCSLLFWGEGSKSASDVRMTNSDPDLVRSFLTLLRSSFAIDEEKFRIVLHLHKYHDIERQKKFWSEVTKIPLKSFSIYLKPNTGKNKKEGYPGCVSLRYSDYKIAIELKKYYQFFSENMRD